MHILHTWDTMLNLWVWWQSVIHSSSRCEHGPPHFNNRIQCEWKLHMQVHSLPVMKYFYGLLQFLTQICMSPSLTVPLQAAALFSPRQVSKKYHQNCGAEVVCVWVGGSFVVIKWTVYMCNFCCMLLMGMSWLSNGSEMRQFAPQRIMLSSAWAPTHVLDHSCSYTHSVSLCNYCVLVLSPFKCHHVCARGEKGVLCLWVYVHLMDFVFSTQANSNMCSWVKGAPAGFHPLIN